MRNAGVLLLTAMAISAGAMAKEPPYKPDAHTGALLHLDGDARDAGGAENDGQLRGKAIWAEGKFGKALALDGEGGAVIRGSGTTYVGLKLWVYDVRTKKYALIKDFSGELPAGHLRQMSKSLDDRVFGLTRQDPKYKVVGYLVWNRENDRLLLNRETRQLDEIQVDKSGRFCVIKTGQGGKGVVEVQVADLSTGKIEDLVDNEPDYAPGHSDNGHGVDLGNDWSQAYHVLLRTRIPGLFLTRRLSGIY